MISSSTPDWLRLQYRRQHRRLDAHQKTAPATIDVDPRQRQDGALDKHRHGFAQSERRRTTDLITSVSLRVVRRTRRNGLASGLAGKLFGRDLALTAHQNQQRPLIFI